MIPTPNSLTEEQFRELVKTKTMSAEMWNKHIEPGTEVTVVLDNRSLLETKTRGLAWEVADGIAVVCVEGKAGGYRLNHVLTRAQAAALLHAQQ